MAKVELKKPIVEEISANIADAQGVVLVNYSGLTVAQDTQLRKELREAGVVYKVYKNTMMNCANIWMEQTLWLSLKKMQLLLQEFLRNSQKQLRSWNW